jgi:hypothetical protein
MFIPKETIKAIRYLCVWRVNSTLVRLQEPLSVNIAYVLATLMSERMSTRVARSWTKNLNSFDSQNIPELLWPIDSAIVPYPSKVTLGQGETIMWELKLFGEDADHEFFLETILPAMEDASVIKDHRWYARNSLWGHFDIDSVYVCHGNKWKPLVEQGSLDLKYHPTPWQWYEVDEIQFSKDVKNITFKHLYWLTTFDLSPEAASDIDVEQDSGRALTRVVEAVIERMNFLLKVSKRTNETIWTFLDKEQDEYLNQALENSENIIHGYHDLEPAPKKYPARWRGTQHFPTKIPSLFLPYLNIASILHIGRYTQYGCGTFLLE